jgi:hypothetical protein
VAIQAIIYSVATGRVRRVVDPQANVPDVIAFLNSAGAGLGEAVLVYTKTGNGQDTLIAWQAAVNAHTGLNPDTTQTDWLAIIDTNNLIVGCLIGDLSCADSSPLGTLIPAPWGCNPAWSYNGITFTPPVIAPLK